MKKHMIVTISREYGSGGHDIADLLAQKLNLKLYDNKLITIAAQESGYPPEVLEEAESTYSNKVSMALGLIGEEKEYSMPLNNRLFNVQEFVIRTIADMEDAVIVGRCADAVLKDYVPCVNIFVQASLPHRVERIMKRYGISEEEAKRRIAKTDKTRSTYYNFYTDKKWGDRRNYDLIINSDIGVEAAAEILFNYVTARYPELKPND